MSSIVKANLAGNLTVDDLASFARFGIEPELLEQAHVERVTDDEAREKFGIVYADNKIGIVFPYIDPLNAVRHTARLRRDNPELENGKSKNKYISPYGDKKHLYFPPGCGDLIDDASVPVVIVEAEKSCLALRAWSMRTGQKILPVATGGVWGWRGKIGITEDAAGQRVEVVGPLPELARTCTPGRKIVIWFDRNVDTNPKVRKARAALEETLLSYDCRVHCASYAVDPRDAGSAVAISDDLEIPAVIINGPDDFCAVHGDMAVRHALDSAAPTQEVAIADATMAISEVQHDSPELSAMVQAAVDAISWIRDGVQREIQEGRLRIQVHGLVSVTTIRDEVARRIRRREQERAEFLQYLEAASQPAVSGADVADEIKHYLKRFMVMSDEYFAILPIWVLHTHCFTGHDARLQIFDHTPYLNINSATKRSAKTTLLNLLAQVSARPWKTQSTSVAALARKVSSERCTMFLDEVDRAFKGPQEFTSALQGILNGGFERGGTYTRCVGEGTNMQSADFSTFGPKAISGIGALPDTITDRAIRVHLRRKNKDEQVERCRHRVMASAGDEIRKQADRWATKSRVDLADREATIIEALNDRAWDVCEPLMRIAEYIGGGWAGRLREALLKVFDTETDDDDITVQLLRDIREVWDEAAAKIFSDDLVNRLKDCEAAPWAEWNQGKGLTKNALARQLKRFGIYSAGTVWINATSGKGYERASFRDAWERYLAPSATAEADTSPTSPPTFSDNQPSHPSGPNNDAAETPFSQSSQEHSQPSDPSGPVSLLACSRQASSLTFELDGCNPHKQSSLTGLTVADEDAVATVSPSDRHKQSVLTVRTVESGRRAGGEVVPTGKATVATEVMTRVRAAGGWLFLRGDGSVGRSFSDCITDADLAYLHGLLDKYENEIAHILRAEAKS